MVQRKLGLRGFGAGGGGGGGGEGGGEGRGEWVVVVDGRHCRTAINADDAGRRGTVAFHLNTVAIPDGKSVSPYWGNHRLQQPLFCFVFFVGRRGKGT